MSHIEVEPIDVDVPPEWDMIQGIDIMDYVYMIIAILCMMSLIKNLRS